MELEQISPPQPLSLHTTIMPHHLIPYLYKKIMEAITEILNKVPELSYSELEAVNETIKKIMAEKRRDEIKQNADESLRLYNEGKLQGFNDPQKMINWLMADDGAN